MNKIDKIKLLVQILEENVNLLDEFPSKVKEWEKKRDEYKEKTGEKYYYHGPYPIIGTSETHIKDIAKLLRKELLKL